MGDPTCPSCGEAWRYYNVRVSGGASVAFDLLPCQDTWHWPLGDPPSTDSSPVVRPGQDESNRTNGGPDVGK